MKSFSYVIYHVFGGGWVVENNTNTSRLLSLRTYESTNLGLPRRLAVLKNVYCLVFELTKTLFRDSKVAIPKSPHSTLKARGWSRFLFSGDFGSFPNLIC